MNLKRIYKYLIWLGLVIFIIGVIGDGKAIRLLSFGAYLGPLLYVTGIFIWIPLRFKKPILHSFNSNGDQSFINSSFAFFMDNFMREFWGFCIVLLMFMILDSSVIIQSNGYKAAISVIENNAEVKAKIGKFKTVGPIVGGSTSSSMVKLGFSIYGSKDSSPLRIELKNENGKWELTSLKLK